MKPDTAETPLSQGQSVTREGEAPWIIDPPTGWPAPFDLVQGLFEGAWNWIGESIDALWQNFVKWATDLWTNLVDAFWTLWLNIVGGLDSLWRSIIFGFDNLWAVFWVHSLPSWDDVRRGLGDVWDGFVDALGDLWTNIVRAFDDFYHAVCDFLFGIADWIYARLLETVGHWDPDQNRFVGGFLGWLWDAIAGTLDFVWNMFSGFGAWLTDCFDWLHSEVVGWLTGAMEIVAGAIGEGLKTLWSWLTETVPSFFAGAASFINESVIAPIMGGLQWVFDRISDAIAGLISSIEDLFIGHSPITGEEALTIGILAAVTAGVSGAVVTALVDIASTKAVGTGLELRAVGRYLGELINPRMFLGAVLGVLVGVGIRTPLTHHYNKLFRPSIPAVREAQTMLWRGKLDEDQFRDVLAMTGYRDIYEEGFVELTHVIPPAPDLIRMVVREAFMPEMVVESPSIFAEYMTKSGYSKEWADRYWTAHFVPIDLRQAYENLWRGYWLKDDFMRALHIADIHPMWREDIYNVAFRPPGVRELGYGYDTNVYSWEDIRDYRRWGGLSLEDAEKAATSMVAYRTEAEREALRREALYDFTEGLDSEETLRVKLEAIGGRPEIIDLWVARAKYRTDRDVKRDLIKVVKDQAIKGLISEVELREDLSTIGVVPERIEVYVLEVETRRARAVVAVTVEKRKLLTEAKLAKAWELGLIGDAEYISGLVERDYTEEDARLLIEILRTPLPITPEEVERRKASVQARINYTKRRYERLIAGLDERAGLISGEIESLEIETKEVLDVIDVEIRTLEEEIAGITPEVLTKPILQAMDRVRRRYERSLARLEARETLLRDDIAAAETIFAETLDVIDVNIKYVEDELIALGAAP